MYVCVRPLKRKREIKEKEPKRKQREKEKGRVPTKQHTHYKTNDYKYLSV